MKKVILLVASMMLVSSLAFGYTFDPKGSWTFVTPYATKIIAGSRITINPSTSYYTIDLNTSNGMDLVQVAPYPTSQPASPVVTTPAYSGSETTTQNKWDPKALGTWAMVIDTSGIPVPFQMVVNPLKLTSDTHLTGKYHIIMGGTDVSQIDFYGDKAVIPIPAAFWLLASGLVGLIGLRRKQK